MLPSRSARTYWRQNHFVPLIYIPCHHVILIQPSSLTLHILWTYKIDESPLVSSTENDDKIFFLFLVDKNRKHEWKKMKWKMKKKGTQETRWAFNNQQHGLYKYGILPEEKKGAARVSFGGRTFVFPSLFHWEREREALALDSLNLKETTTQPLLPSLPLRRRKGKERKLKPCLHSVCISSQGTLQSASPASTFRKAKRSKIVK